MEDKKIYSFEACSRQSVVSEKNESATLQRHDGPRGALAPGGVRLETLGTSLVKCPAEAVR